MWEAGTNYRRHALLSNWYRGTGSCSSITDLGSEALSVFQSTISTNAAAEGKGLIEQRQCEEIRVFSVGFEKPEDVLEMPTFVQTRLRNSSVDEISNCTEKRSPNSSSEASCVSSAPLQTASFSRMTR